MRFRGLGIELKSCRYNANLVHLYCPQDFFDSSQGIINNAILKKNFDVNKFFCDNGIIKKYKDNNDFFFLVWDEKFTSFFR